MKYISLGHLTLSDENVSDIEWHVSLDGQIVNPVDDALTEWNYFSNIGLSCVLTVELDQVRRTLEIANDLQLSWFMVTSCRPSPVAITSQPFPLIDGRQEISLTLPPGSVSGQLSIELMLTVSSPSKFEIEGFAPKKVGQTVYRTTKKLSLEGEGGQLPLLPVSFREQNIPHADSSLWWLRILTKELDESANSALWLWINTDNVEMEPLIDQIDGPSSQLWLKFLQLDFVRQLLSEGLRNHDLDTNLTYPDGSLGELLAGVVKLVGASIEDVRADYGDDPGRVEAKLQAIVNGVQ